MKTLTAMLLLALGGAFAQTPAPALPHESKNVSTNEAQVYREWTALKDMPVFDAASEPRKPVGMIRKGEKVTALGGNVITYRPGVVHMDRDLPELNLKRGDTILTYADHGEGFSQVWFNGRFHEDYDISFAKWPDGTGCGGAHCAATYVDVGKKEWWVELKLKSGAKAWVNVPDWREGDVFDGINRYDSK